MNYCERCDKPSFEETYCSDCICSNCKDDYRDEGYDYCSYCMIEKSLKKNYLELPEEERHEWRLNIYVPREREEHWPSRCNKCLEFNTDIVEFYSRCEATMAL